MLLEHLSKKTLPPVGTIQEIELPTRDGQTTLLVRNLESDLILKRFCVPALFKIISLNVFLDLLTAILTERQVIFQSEHLGVLSACSFALFPILKPFIIQGAFIPIVPGNLTMCLQAPVPYVMY